MKIVVINPNSSEAMTEDIRTSAGKYAAGEYEVEVYPTPGAPEFIDSYQDVAEAIPGMIELIRKLEAEADAFVIACHGDPGIDILKEISSKPVVGIGEASMKVATMLGHKFSVLTTSRRSIAGKEAVITQYRLTDSMASVRAPEHEDADADEKSIYLEAGKAALEKDGAEVLVLGCAGLTGLDETLMEELKVPVMDGVKCALMIASGLVKMHVGISRQGRYYGKES